jgi:dihydroneopterin triphosphate diphosphatase
MERGCSGQTLEGDGKVPGIVTDSVDAYVFRHMHGRAEFLLLKRADESPIGGTWHGVHGRINPDETALAAATRAVRVQTGLEGLVPYSADYINQFFDHKADSIVLAPVFAFAAPTDSKITPAREFGDFAWCDREEATGRLTFAGQRWAVRHIEDIIAQPGVDAEIYLID